MKLAPPVLLRAALAAKLMKRSVIFFVLVVCSIGSGRAVALVIVHGRCLVVGLVILDFGVLADDFGVLVILFGLLVIAGAVAAV